MTELLSDTNLHIYVSLSGNALPYGLEREYLAMLPAGFRAAILRYDRWQDRQAALFGKLLLLKAMQSQFSDAGLQKLQSLQTTRYGRPFIPGGPDFNISHSEDLVALAVAQHGAVGIDVEKIRPVHIPDFSQSIPEVANLPGDTSVEEVQNLFFHCWTQKEAVVKGLGKGLLVPLEKVAVTDGTALVEGTAWFIKELPLEEGYCSHAATDRPLSHITIERVDLMNGFP